MALSLAQNQGVVKRPAFSDKLIYDSPTAFNRAFHKFHGSSPRSARRPETVLKAYPPISFNIAIKGAIIMNYQIVEQEPFRVIGVKMSTTTKNGENFQEIP